MKMLSKSAKSQQIYDFLFNSQNLVEIKYYYFLIIDLEKNNDIYKISNFFEEMFLDVVFLEYEELYLMFYFVDFDIEIENIINSIVDDFSFKLKIYSSSKVNSNNSQNFFMITNLYKKYLRNKSDFHLTNIDLVSEIIRVNIQDIKLIKPIILKDILDDPQIEGLIHSMFKNSLNVTKTASDIYMHRNTVINKLEYIKKETGLNLQKFLDANIMYWLLKIK